MTFPTPFLVIYSATLSIVLSTSIDDILYSFGIVNNVCPIGNQPTSTASSCLTQDNFSKAFPSLYMDISIYA